MTDFSDMTIAVIGAGPAGLGCAYGLTNAGCSPIVIEKESVPGGLCRTLEFNGYLFDIGGHRFLSDSGLVNNLWQEILGDDLLRVERNSSIFYDKNFFKYPLAPLDVFSKLGVRKSLICVGSYVKARILNQSESGTFEDHMINRFGKKLYAAFFRDYTEKICGISCKEISSDWARDRIQSLSLWAIIKKAFLNKYTGDSKSLTDIFYYPKKGAGSFYAGLADSVSSAGAIFRYNKKLQSIFHKDGKIQSIEILDALSGDTEQIQVDCLFSSAPLTETIKMLYPLVANDVVLSAEKLKFRAFITVNIILSTEKNFSEQWIYVHDPKIQMGRIQNCRKWSSYLSGGRKSSSLEVEYFCNEGDSLWQLSDAELIDMAVKELQALGIAEGTEYADAFVARSSHAYPLYTIDYKKHLDKVKNCINQFSNFQTIGRAGLFQYQNSDDALLEGILSVEKAYEKSQKDICMVKA